MPKFLIQTYGCQMNYSDTERMEGYLEALGFSKTENIDDAEFVIFNTCSVKQKAEDKVLGRMKTIRKLKQKNPNVIFVITGCMTRTSSSRYSEQRDRLFGRLRELDIVLKTEELPVFAKLIREIRPDLKISKIKEESLEDYFQIKATHNTLKSRNQAFLPISNGCDKFCTYCIVPYSRGREKSRKLEDILKEAEKLVEEGYKEITLLGQTVNSYGLSNYDKQKKTFEAFESSARRESEQGEKSGSASFEMKRAYRTKAKQPFVYLLEQMNLLHEKGLERVRFTSPHPKDMSDQLIEAMANLRTQMPYLHLPVQAGDDNLLKRMNRSYTLDEYRKIVQKLREKIPGISISTDMIVGFCGETEEEFQNSYKFFEEMEFEHAYPAKYSNRKGTTADKLMKDDIPEKTKKERWEALNELLKKQSKKAHEKFVGKEVKVLVETQKGEICTGRSEHYKTVQFKSNKNLLGKIVPVKLTKAREWIIEGELV